MNEPFRREQNAIRRGNELLISQAVKFIRRGRARCHLREHRRVMHRAINPDK